MFSLYAYTTSGVIHVTDTNMYHHIIYGSVIENIPDGVTVRNYRIPDAHIREPAFWILTDISQAWKEIHSQTGIIPGSVEARWEPGRESLNPCGSSACYWPHGGPKGVFIPESRLVSADTIRHEAAHSWMHTRQGSFWYTVTNPIDFYECVVTGHTLWEQNTQLCAYTEGWADWVAVWFDSDPNDHCYDFGLTQCSISSVDFENQGPGDGRPEGDEVEARVAGALMDWVDTNNDNLDTVSDPATVVWERSIPFRRMREVWISYPTQTLRAALLNNTIDPAAYPAADYRVYIPTVTKR